MNDTFQHPVREHEGRVAVITGGGRGFGQAFARALVTRGARVVLADVDIEAATAVASRLRGDGGQAHAIHCDVSDETDVRSLMDDTLRLFSGIDILINNAGLHSTDYNQTLLESGPARIRRLFDVNIMGVVLCTLAAYPAMVARPNASIVNISSSAASQCATAYGVSKLAVRGLTLTAAREFGPDGIRVNAIAPGLMLTDTIRAETAPATLERIQGMQFLRTSGTEDDVVAAMLYLCSEGARFVTGETILVGGGFAASV